MTLAEQTQHVLYIPKQFEGFIEVPLGDDAIQENEQLNELTFERRFDFDTFILFQI